MKIDRRIHGMHRRPRSAASLALALLAFAALAGCRGWREVYIRKGECIAT